MRSSGFSSDWTRTTVWTAEGWLYRTIVIDLSSRRAAGLVDERRNGQRTHSCQIYTDSSAWPSVRGKLAREDVCLCQTEVKL